jgi:DNA-binding CsgD family transcriptional regulator/tetratricopeptide (TPR) repeat protein
MSKIVGRDAELAALGEVLAGLRAGRGRAVLVEGEAGIGKSALVATALAGVDSGRTRILAGTCDELTQRFPLSAVTEAVGPGEGLSDITRGRSAALNRETAAGLGLAGGDPVLAAVEELLGRVHKLCAEGPLVLVLEDLHWADEASVLWWRRLGQVTPQLPLVLMGTRRAVPRPAGADALGREVQARQGVVLSLGGLAPGAVVTMAADLVGGAPGPRLVRWLEHAGGNPFYVRELVDEATRAGMLQGSGGVAELQAPGSGMPSAGGGLASDPAVLRAAVEGRLGFLPEDALRVLRIAALLGPEFLLSDLAAVCERTAAGLLPVLEDAFAAGVLEDGGGRLRFRHGLLQQALYEGIPGPVRAGLHRQAARTLMELDAPAERVARQLLAVPEENAGEGWEADWLAARAAALARRVPAVAAELLERTLRQGRPGGSRRARLEDDLLEALFILGRYEQTEQLAQDVLPRVGDPDRYGQVAWLRGYALLRARRYHDAEAALEAAARRPDVPAVWQARHSALRAMVVKYIGPRADAARYAAAALAAGRELGDTTATAYALHAQAIQCFDDGDFRAACRLTDEALLVAERDPRLGDLRLGDLRLMVTYNRASYGAELGGHEEAWNMIRNALARGEMSGSPRLRSLHGMAAYIAYETGRWDEAIGELDAATDPAPGVEPISATERQCVRALIAGHRDEWPEADGFLTAFRSGTNEFAPSAGDESATKYIVAGAVLEIERSGEPGRAVSLLAQWLEPGLEDRLLRFLYKLLPALVRLCLAAEDESAAQAAARAALREAGRDPLARKQATAQWCQGLVRGDAEAVLAAAGSLRGDGLLLYAGSAFEDAAVLLAQGGEAAQARAALGEALDLYGGIGAVWDSRRAAARVRPLGIRLGVRGLRRRPQTGWPSLTEMEQQVAGLVAAGRSNPDIAAQLYVSRRTVESHVSRILAKLQLSSRWEVKDAAQQAAADAHGAGPR